ncbi:CopG family ribbon-helix-helix protein [Zavarzinia sp.]|uniref:CopG family ribbon-helix-helix protein n=1 Tax=Zavarzinia sp. TaxID=2027920 RepID=UPI003BB64333
MPTAPTIRLDDETAAALDRLTDQTGRPRQWLVAQAIADDLTVNAWQVERIKDGLAAAHRGDFASDEEMAAIARKFAPR